MVIPSDLTYVILLWALDTLWVERFLHLFCSFDDAFIIEDSIGPG